jgi:hypothetical protein
LPVNNYSAGNVHQESDFDDAGYHLERKFHLFASQTFGAEQNAGPAARKITSTWKDKGEYAGFNAHLRTVARQFPHIEVHPEIWLKTRSSTSASAHLFMTAVQQWQQEQQVKVDQRHQSSIR